MSNLNGSSGNGNTAPDGVLHVAFVLDRSGSMQAVAEAVVDGYNDYLSELREQGGETLYSLTTFNTSFEHMCIGAPLDQAPRLDHRIYQPDGMTALYDAIAHSVLDTERRLQAEGRAKEKVLVVVMTDGLENSSTDYDAHSIAELVRSYDERPNWTFVYLGAGHATVTDAQHAAAGIGYRSANAMHWTADPASTRKSMHSLAHATGHHRASSDRKSERFFEEAGQSEADYRDEPAPARPQHPSPPGLHPTWPRRRIHRRELGDALKKPD